MTRYTCRILLGVCLLILVSVHPLLASEDWHAKIQEEVLTQIASGEAEFLVLLTDQADVSAAARLPLKDFKGHFVHRTLVAHASGTQQQLIEVLETRGAEYHSYWITNMLWVQGEADLLENLARRPDVAHIVVNATIGLQKEQPADTSLPEKVGIEWNIDHINAPAVWAEGVRGNGVVIGSMDTGVDWDHPALINQYRGWNGATASHDFNWHDAIHAGAGICGPDNLEPCDDQGHGSHILGIAVGDDGTNQIGVAPAATWIACRCMSEGLGSVASYLECLEWFMAPTDLNGENPDPTLAPDILHNSWVCVAFEGCTDPLIFQTTFANIRAAGIALVAAAGNAGPSCESIAEPPGIYDEVLTVGATTNLDQIAVFSGRGPVAIDGSDRLKPDVVAPGMEVRSSFFFGAFHTQSGTSQAAPHVVGLLALLIAADPSLRGQVDVLEDIVRETAVPLVHNQPCGGLGGEVPNNVTGYGRIDAWAAYQQVVVTGVANEESPRPEAAILLKPNYPNPFNPRTVIPFQLTQPAVVDLTIHDLRGRQVRRLLASVSVDPGTHQARWDGLDARQLPVGAGTYMVRLSTEDVTQTRRLTLVR